MWRIVEKREWRSRDQTVLSIESIFRSIQRSIWNEATDLNLLLSIRINLKIGTWHLVNQVLAERGEVCSGNSVSRCWYAALNLTACFFIEEEERFAADRTADVTAEHIQAKFRP